MSSFETDRNLLVGILGLQMGFITEPQLISAMQAWIFRKSEKIEDLLLEQKALQLDMHDFLVGMADRHIAVHANDPSKSLAALSSLAKIQKQLEEVQDIDVNQSVTRAFESPKVGSMSEGLDSLGMANAQTGPSRSPADRYHILRPHAKGGLGQVSVAEDTELHREVALKEIQPRFAEDPGSRGRFMLEAEVTGGLEHPGIVPVYSLGKTANGNPFYVMRFIRGDSLKEAIEHLHSKDNVLSTDDKKMTLRRLLRRLIDVCNAIEYAHSRGVLHRDLKPGNVMLGKYGETLVVDWGLAKTGPRSETHRSDNEETFIPLSGDSSTQTRFGSVVGTPAYMSPEQAAGNLSALGPTSDVYGLGATMYSILTGVAPFADVSGKTILERVIAGQIKPPREINPTIPEALQAICLKALAKNQSDRYPTAASLAQDLELWLSDETVSAFREPWTDRAVRFMRRHRTMAISSIAVLLTSLLALLVINTLVRNQNGNLKIERDMAEASRQEAIQEKLRAEENLGVARTTSLNMLTTAEERLSGSSISSQTALSLRMMLTEQAYKSFQTLYDQNQNDSDLAFEFAQTSRISANLKRLIRDLKSADEQIEKSLRIQLQTPVDQLSLKRKDYLAETYRDIATLRRLEGRLEDAEVALKAGTELVKELQAKEPENPAFMRTLAVIEVEEIGLHSDRLELDLALQKANSSAATFQKLMDTGSSIPMDASVLLMARSRQVLLLFKLGRLDEAKAAYIEAIASGREWQGKRPDDDDIALPIARILYWSAEQLVNVEGPSDDAATRVAEAIAISDDLVKKRLHAGYLYAQGDSLRVQAKILRLQGKFDEARNAIAKSRTILESLVKVVDRSDNRDCLAKTLHELSMLKRDEKDKSASSDYLKEAVNMQTEACRLSPSNVELQTHLDELTTALNSTEASL